MQFADGIADVVILGPIARIEFFALRPASDRKNEAGQPELQRIPTFTVAMPVEGVASSASILENVRNKLIESGVLRQAGVCSGAPDNTVRHKNASPNFNAGS